MEESHNTWEEWLKEQEATDILSLEQGLLKRPWKPETADCRAAWLLYSELRTRIATQPLHYLAGDEKAALTSIYQIFELVRELVKDENLTGAHHFAELAVAFLNRQIRPFTAKWHTLEVAGFLDNQDLKNSFRQDLTLLQKKIRIFCNALGALAEGDDFVVPSPDSYDAINDSPDLGAPIPLPTTDRYAPAGHSQPDATALNFAKVLEEEKEQIKNRRIAAGLPSDDEVNNIAGLALSGGGIRSATLGLGVLQSLGKTGVLNQIDYLSTVSGGGYTGSFISTYLDNSGQNTNSSQQTLVSTGLHRSSDPLGQNSESSLAIEHLRQNSRFLLSGGIVGVAKAAGQLVYGIAIQLLLVFSVVFLIAGALHLVIAVPAIAEKHWLSFPLHIITALPRIALYSCIIVWLLALAVLPIVRSSRAQYKWWVNIAFWAGVLVLSILALCSLHLAFQSLIPKDNANIIIGQWLALQIALPLALAFLGYYWGVSSKIGSFLLKAAFVLMSVIFILGLLAFSLDIFIHGTVSVVGQLILKYQYWTLLPMVIFLLALFFLDINYMTLHRYYRDQLASAYCIKANYSDDKVEDNAEKKLTNLRRNNAALPYHLLNATLNGTSDDTSRIKRTQNDYFFFSQCFIGSSATGYWHTKHAEDADNNLTLSTAMAISGAAVAPNMGTSSLNVAKRLLAAANLRLNYWFCKPSISTKIVNTENISTYKSFENRMVKSRAAVSQKLDEVGGYLAKNNDQSEASTANDPGKRNKRIALSNASIPGLINLLYEYRGDMPVSRDYLNLSDGGHIENLGLYELLRRKCKFIIAIDGEADAAMSRGAINKIIRVARQDLNIDLRIDTSRLALEDTGYSCSHFTFGEINYRNSSGANDTEKGFLLYIKSSMTGNEPDDVLDYKRRNPDFPHQSTADQFFDEEQFEAYRALGFHMGEELFTLELGGTELARESAVHVDTYDASHGNLDIEMLFERLAATLLTR